MTTSQLFSVLAVAGTLALTASASELPLGHPDFYPSATSPVGWRGDGTGAWPGATPVTTWNAVTGENVAWKTAMPGPSFSQPIVVGDKVFALADPATMVCLSAKDGRILWQTPMDHSTLLPPEDHKAYPAAVAFWEDMNKLYVAWRNRRGSAELLARADKAAEEYLFGKNATGQANYYVLGGKDKNHPIRVRLRQDQQRFGFFYLHAWDALMTGTFATPVSDGQHVYAIGSNDQIACFDLQGKLVWMILDRVDGKRPDALQCQYASSPQLCGDVLIVTMAGYMRGYDKGTGKRLWVTEKNKNLAGYHSKVGSQMVMQLKAGGQPLPVVCATGAGFYRVSDGKKIGELPGLAGYEGSTMLIDGDIIIRQSAPDSGTRGIYAHRVMAKSQDEVVIEELWRQEGKEWGGNTTALLYQGKVYRTYAGNFVDVKTGQAGTLEKGASSNISPALGGNVIIGIAGGSANKRTGNKTPMYATVTTLDGKTHRVEHAFADDRYEKDEDYFLEWSFRAADKSNSSPMFQGNRLFFRTHGYLWSIGTKEWITPASAPPDARVNR